MSALAAAAVQVTERPLVKPLAHWVERNRFGLLKRLNLPAPLETALACVLLDYTLYLWHVLTHKVPLLWRFHRVHHADLGLDATTALRFHFGEMALSAGWRAAQVAAIGVSPRALSVWYTLLLPEVMFHHSNVELPPRVERWLRLLVVTPRMHGIHHSVVEDEVNSNWSSGLTVWDYLHRTLRLGTPQEQITIGVPELRHPSQVTLPRLVVMPFGPQPAALPAASPGSSMLDPPVPDRPL